MMEDGSPRFSDEAGDTPTGQHRPGSIAYAGRTGDEDVATQWRTANCFEHCVSVRLDGARGLPKAFEMICEVQAGQRVRLMPLLLSHSDLEAGGGGRIDGGHVSERTDLLTDVQPTAVEVRLMVKAHGPMWTKRTQKFVIIEDMILKCDLPIVKIDGDR